MSAHREHEIGRPPVAGHRAPAYPYQYGRSGLVAVPDLPPADEPDAINDPALDTDLDSNPVLPAPREQAIRLTDPACKGEDPEVFFPIHETRAAAEPAKEICRRCPNGTVAACLKYALSHEVEGIWGATTQVERDRLREKFGIVASRSSPPPTGRP